MSKYTVDSLSLSYIGDLLRDRLGDNASQYLFPDDFEKAVVDIGFGGVVIDGTSSPYDEIIFIGDGAGRSIRTGRSDLSGPSLPKYKKATFIKATSVPPYCLCYQTELTDVVFCDSITSIETGALSYTSSLIKDIVLPSAVTKIDNRAFYQSGISSISGAGVTSIPAAGANNNGVFYNCPNLKNVYFPKLSTLPATATRGAFMNCIALETVQIGSIGYPITSITAYVFQGCTSPFTITIYTEGSQVDTLVTNVRSSCANATIVVKASADTTYNGVSYLAGATIKTSTP